MKNLLLIAILCLSTSAFSQKGYVKQTIINGDTSTVFVSEQIYWKLIQRVDDAILESKLNVHGSKIDKKYPVISRELDGYIKEYVVSGRDIESFIIRFHTGDNTVTYIYPNETIIYRGDNISIRL